MTAAPLTEKDIIAAMKRAIEFRVKAAGIADCAVLRNYQERKIARDRTKPLVLINKLFESRYAFKKVRYKGEKGEIERESQRIETTYQISAISPMDKCDAADLIRYAQDALQMRAGLNILLEKGIRPIKAGNIRMAWVDDEADSNTAMPSFDIVIEWTHQVDSPAEYAESVSGKTRAAIDRKGQKNGN